MTVLFIDFETRSAADLKAAGLHNYATHPTTDVWCLAYAFDDEDVGVIAPRDDHGWHSDDLARIVCHLARKDAVVVAHNAAFELAIWNSVCVPRYGWPRLDPAQTRDTMAMAYAQALPGSLEKAAAAAGIEMQKDMSAHRLMLQYCRSKEIKPDGTIIWWNDPTQLGKLFEYCKQDVRVERELYKRLMPLSDDEQALWVLDHKINQRGVYVDKPVVEKAIAVVQAEQDRLNLEMRNVTGNFVGFCTEAARLTKWVQSQGVAVDGIAKADVVEALALPGLPEHVRMALLLRQEAAKSSTAKLRAMLEAASKDDGRLRGMLQYHGAGTGRWAGRRVQLQNIPRWPDWFKEASAEHAIEIISARPAAVAADFLRTFYDSPMTVISYLLRPLLCAAPGNVLYAADAANIEGRGLMWLAGEEWKLDAFRAYDAGTGPDLYKVMASEITGKPTDQITGEERQARGKVPELACGYGGGVGAFQSMAKIYNVKMTDEEADRVKVLWREKHPKTVNYWYALERAAHEAVLNPGRKCSAGEKGRETVYKMAGSFLWCRLPSGRVLCYPYPKIKPKLTPWGETRDQLHYMTVDGTTNKWVETHTYGGKLAENVTQAICRDLLVSAIRNAEAKGYQVVMHVHDEVVSEVKAGTGSLEEFESVWAPPQWAEGLPVVASGWTGRRYRK